jgi:predicted oxidoreductase
MSGGQIFNGATVQIQCLRRTLEEIRESIGNVSMDQGFLACLMMHPSNPIPVMGTGKLERLQRVVEATKLALTREQWYKRLEASVGNEML